MDDRNSGLRLCRLDEIPDGEARGFIVADAGGRRSIFVFRDGERVFGYVNACPHIGSPLDWVEDQFMAPDGNLFQCATHGALFRTHDGYCVAGPCAGASLATAAVELRDSEVICR
ncbi:MAG: Rieske (2Fe-2S) protein [Dongiaceae bacterium]